MEKKTRGGGEEERRGGGGRGVWVAVLHVGLVHTYKKDDKMCG